MSTHQFEYKGRKLKFETLSGEVIDTQQRSDTVVSGYGNMSINNGVGSGNSRISSQIYVSRDIWIKNENSKESHLRYNFDIPVRAGHQLVQIFLSGEHLIKNSTEMSLLNANTQENWWVDGNKNIAKKERNKTFFATMLRWIFRAELVFILMFVVGMVKYSSHTISTFEIVQGFFLGIAYGSGIGLLMFLMSDGNKKMDEAIRNEHAKFISTFNVNV